MTGGCSPISEHRFIIHAGLKNGSAVFMHGGFSHARSAWLDETWKLQLNGSLLQWAPLAKGTHLLRCTPWRVQLLQPSARSWSHWFLVWPRMVSRMVSRCRPRVAARDAHKLGRCCAPRRRKESFLWEAQRPTIRAAQRLSAVDPGRGACLLERAGSQKAPLSAPTLSPHPIYPIPPDSGLDSPVAFCYP